MSALISNNDIITLSRGDTFEAPLFINYGNKLHLARFVLKEGDAIYIGITEPNQPFECAIIRKKYTVEDLNRDGDIVFKLDSKDTEFLLPGLYYFEAKIDIVDGEEHQVQTIVPKRKFFIQ